MSSVELLLQSQRFQNFNELPALESKEVLLASCHLLIRVDAILKESSRSVERA